MIIPTFLFFKRLWWLPTDEDRANYRKERKDSWRAELPQINTKLLEATEKYGDYLNKLEKTFSKEQWEIYLEVKTWAQKASFQNGRKKHHEEELLK